jgi:hypothetical protein
MFYKSKNSKSYPDGRIEWCKKCMTEYKKKKKIEVIKPVYKVVNGEIWFHFD